jgi:hypothetical protein
MNRRKEMNKSESIKNIAKALSDLQGEIQNPKNTANNPFFNSKYAPLPDVIAEARPLLKKYGLSILQSPSGDGQNITVTTLIMHESGEWIETEPLTLKADKITAQGAGSAITYGRRYSLSAVLNISSEDDDDGNHASKKTCEDCGEEIKATKNKTVEQVISGSQQYYKKNLCSQCVSKRYRESQNKGANT